MSEEIKRILIIEDNLNNIKLMTMLLEQNNYQVNICDNAEDGIKRAVEINPDLILLDIQLPEMDGTQACRILRENLMFDNTPIIALTAFAMPGDREKILQYGFNGYMAKPFNYKEFLFLIENLTDEK